MAAIIWPEVTPYDPSYQNPSPSLSLQPPSAAYLLGTTQSGQDVLSQLLVGIRLTLETYVDAFIARFFDPVSLEARCEARDLMAPVLGKKKSQALMAAVFDIERLADARALRRLYSA